MPLKIITDIPPDQVAAFVQLFTTAGATSVTPTKQADGNFTLVVIYPDVKALAAGLASTE